MGSHDCHMTACTTITRLVQQADQVMHSPNGQNLVDLLLKVGRGGYDEQTVQEIDGDTMRTHVLGATDSREVRRSM